MMSYFTFSKFEGFHMESGLRHELERGEKLKRNFRILEQSFCVSILYVTYSFMKLHVSKSKKYIQSAIKMA